MRYRAGAWLARCLCAVCVALASCSLVLAVLNGRTPREMLIEEGIPAVATLAVAFSVVGALLASHRPANPIGWVFSAAALFQGLSICGYEYATYALLTEPGALPFGTEVAWLSQWIWAPGLGLILVFLPLLFPDGRLPSRRWHPVAWLGALSIFLISMTASILLWSERGLALLRPESPAEEGTSQVLFVVVAFAAFPMMLLAGLGAVISLFVRFRRATGEERQQIKWFAYAAALTLLWMFLAEAIPDSNPLFEDLTALAGLLVVPSIPVSAGVAIFRHRLYDIDRIINRTLVYAMLTAALALVYIGGVATLQLVFRALTGQGSQLAIVASTLAIAALFGPLRRRVQGFIDRRFYRNKYDAKRTLEAFANRLRDETDLERLGDELVSVARGTVQPEHASLWLRASGRVGAEER